MEKSKKLSKQKKQPNRSAAAVTALSVPLSQLAISNTTNNSNGVVTTLMSSSWQIPSTSSSSSSSVSSSSSSSRTRVVGLRARVKVDISSLPSVVMSNILSYLPLTIGYDHGEHAGPACYDDDTEDDYGTDRKCIAAAGSECLMSVSRDWFTYVRDIARPSCIKWIHPLADRHYNLKEYKTSKKKEKGFSSSFLRRHGALLLAKYPNAINALSLVNMPLGAIAALVAIKPSSLVALQSLSLTTRDINDDNDALWSIIANNTVHGIFRRITVQSTSGYAGSKRNIKKIPFGMATSMWRLLAPYRAAATNDDNNNNDDTKKEGSRYGQVPIIEVNGEEPIECTDCKRLTWKLLNSNDCDDCGKSERPCCRSNSSRSDGNDGEEGDEDTGMKCTSCDTIFVSCCGRDEDEAQECENCEERACLGCFADCPRCDHSSCKACMTPCKGCETLFCTWHEDATCSCHPKRLGYCSEECGHDGAGSDASDNDDNEEGDDQDNEEEEEEDE